MKYTFKTAEFGGDSFEFNFYASSKEDAMKKLSKCVDLTWEEPKNAGFDITKLNLNTIPPLDSLTPVRI